MTAPLADGQWQLDDGPVLGHRTPYIVEGFSLGEEFGETQDRAIERSDGRRFGRDFLAGQTLTLDLAVSGTGETVHGLYNTLSAVWWNRDKRLTPGAVSTLRYRQGGAVRRLYGRPRHFTPNYDLSRQGVIRVTATFETVGPWSLDDEAQESTVDIVAPLSAGVVSPVVSPVSTVEASTRQGDILVDSEEPTWLVVRINGPITNPTVEVLNRWSATLDVSLASDDYVLIDPRPWSRGVTTRFGHNLAGAFTYDSQPLSEFLVPPGPNTVVLRGTDATGTASMTVSWRGTHYGL